MQRRRLQTRAPAGARVVLRESGRKEAQEREEALRKERELDLAFLDAVLKKEAAQEASENAKKAAYAEAAAQYRVHLKALAFQCDTQPSSPLLSTRTKMRLSNPMNGDAKNNREIETVHALASQH